MYEEKRKGSGQSKKENDSGILLDDSGKDGCESAFTDDRNSS